MTDFATAFSRAQAAYDQGNAVKARQWLAQALEHARYLPADRSAQTLPAIIMAAESDVMQGDYEAARTHVRMGFAVVSRLPSEARDDPRLQLQTIQLNCALKEGELKSALELFMAGLRPRALERGERVSAFRFARTATELLREIGLRQMALELLDYMQARLLPVADVPRLEAQMSLHHLRIVIGMHGVGRSLRLLGPLGWDQLAPSHAQRVLDAALRDQRADIPRARALGRDAYADMADMMQQAVACPADDARQLARRIQQTRARVQYQKQHGYLADLMATELELTALLIADGQLLGATEALRHLKPEPRLAQHVLRKEEWYWQMHLCQQGLGQPTAALQAYRRYASLADERRELASKLLARGLQLEAATESGAASTTDGADIAFSALQARLEALAPTASSVDALAAGLGMSTRRLQQIFKAHGLPSPAQYLKERASARQPQANGARADGTQWDSLTR